MVLSLVDQLKLDTDLTIKQLNDEIAKFMELLVYSSIEDRVNFFVVDLFRTCYDLR